jgi:hypothetical protein
MRITLFTRKHIPFLHLLGARPKEYARALAFFARWKARGVVDTYAMEAALDKIATSNAAPPEADGAAKAKAAARINQLKLDYLREQIEMRVVGLGFTEFKTPWSSSTDETVGSLEALTQLLTDILWDERARQIDGDLPEVAVVPIMKRKTFKQLGTPTAQATELAQKIKDLSDEELLELAEEERQRLEEEGELDAIGDVQQEEAPAINDSLIGSGLEVCWRCADHSPPPARRRHRMRSPPPQRTLATVCSLPRALICLLSDRRYWRKPTKE